MIDPTETQTWPLRVVQPGSHAPAAGVPVSLLDAAGNPAGYWVSDAQGLVPIPRIDATSVRLRVGLRSEEPQEIAVSVLEGGLAEVSAPTTLVPDATEQRLPVAGARTLAPVETVGHDLTLRFSRLAVLPLDEETGAAGAPVASQSPIDFFESPIPATRGVRYGALVELELYWQSLGYAAGDLLYTGTLAGGEELAFDVFDARWRWSWGPTRGASRPARPVELIARLIAGSTLANALTTEDGALPLEPFTLPPSANGTGLSNAAVECVRELLERTGHAASTLRRRALRVAEAAGPPANGSVRRVVKNPDPRRPLGVHFFEPLERFRIGARAARVRPAVLIPFQLPNLATRATIQRFATPMRRVLLDRTLLPDLDWVIGIGRKPLEPDIAPPISELRLVVQIDPQAAPVDLRQVWTFLHADQARYAVHFFPAEQPAQAAAPGFAPPRPTRWIGAIRLADFHQQPLRFPGHLTLENGSRAVLSFAALHVEGRAGDHWNRLLSIRDFVLNKESHAHLASLAALAEVPGVDPRESRLLGHIAANLPYYAAALIAAGDPTMRYLALAKVVDNDGRSLADMIENRVVGIVGNYIACPLRTATALPAPLRTRFAGLPAIRTPAEISITVPIPGLWLSQQAATNGAGEAARSTEILPDDQWEHRPGGRWHPAWGADSG